MPNIHRTLARRLLVGAALFSLCAAVPAGADDEASFFKGKTITIDVGYGAGGGYDVTARVVAQYYGNHIPGHPRVVVENKPGGGGLTVANAIYNTTPKDGLTLGEFASDVALEPLFGNAEARFKPANFSWIGSMDTDLQACAVWKGAGVGIKTLPDLLKAGRPIVFGASSPVSDTSTYPLFFKSALKAPVKVIHGYSGTQTIILAMQKGEVDGVCGIFESAVRGTYKRDVAAGDLNFFTQIILDDRTSPTFGGATPVVDLIKGDRLKAVANFLFVPSLLARPLAAPPGTPTGRVAILRKALIETESDPQVLALAEKAGMSLRAKSGKEVDALIGALQGAPSEVVREAYNDTH